MEAIEAEVLDNGGKNDARGRRVLPAHEWSRLLNEYDQSGLTQRAFARREGINLHTLVAQLGRRRREARSCGQQIKAVRFQEVALAPRTSSGLEVHLPDGLVLKGSSPGDLAALALELRRGTRC